MKILFSCTVDLDEQCAVAHLNGELDKSNVGCLTARLRPLAAAGRDMVVDLSGLSFFGTAGLTALANLQWHAAMAGGSVRLAGLPAPVRRLLAVTGTQDWFTIDAATARTRTPLGNSAAGHSRYR
jgi:anti-sigma B factor antagonist